MSQERLANAASPCAGIDGQTREAQDRQGIPRKSAAKPRRYGIAKINFNAFTTTGYGCTVAASDVESDGAGCYGDGYQEIVAGKGPGPRAPSTRRSACSTTTTRQWR